MAACPPTHAQEASIIRGPERILTDAGMHHKIEFFGTKQGRYRLDNPTSTMIKWDVATVLVPIASVRRMTMHGNEVVLEKEHSYIEITNGNRMELVVQGNVRWLRAKVLNGDLDGKLLCMDE